MTRSQSVWILLATTVCLGIGIPARAKENTRHVDSFGCQVLVTSIPDNPKGRRPIFSASVIDDLGFEIVLRVRREPVNALKMRVFMPTEQLYQEFDVPVSMPSSRERERRMRGYPFPMKVRRARHWRPQYFIVDGPSLPVAGTYITDHSLWGMWRVEVWPEGSDKSCQARFKITP
jgi:hypothetical protein